MKVPIVLASSAAALAAAAVFIAGRRFNQALGSLAPEDRSDRALLQQSRSLSRHLESNPKDVFAADLLQDVDLELIRRAA